MLAWMMRLCSGDVRRGVAVELHSERRPVLDGIAVAWWHEAVLSRVQIVQAFTNQCNAMLMI